jgi:hypothetical protein
MLTVRSPAGGCRPGMSPVTRCLGPRGGGRGFEGSGSPARPWCVAVRLGRLPRVLRRCAGWRGGIGASGAAGRRPWPRPQGSASQAVGAKSGFRSARRPATLSSVCEYCPELQVETLTRLIMIPKAFSVMALSVVSFGRVAAALPAGSCPDRALDGAMPVPDARRRRCRMRPVAHRRRTMRPVAHRPRTMRPVAHRPRTMRPVAHRPQTPPPRQGAVSRMARTRNGHQQRNPRRPHSRFLFIEKTFRCRGHGLPCRRRLAVTVVTLASQASPRMRAAARPAPANQPATSRDIARRAGSGSGARAAPGTGGLPLAGRPDRTGIAPQRAGNPGSSCPALAATRNPALARAPGR